MTEAGCEQDFVRYRDRADGAALARAFDRLALELLLVAAHLAPRGCDAEDLVRANFVDAIRSVHRWDPARRLLPWLVGILASKR